MVGSKKRKEKRDGKKKVTILVDIPNNKILDKLANINDTWQWEQKKKKMYPRNHLKILNSLQLIKKKKINFLQYLQPKKSTYHGHADEHTHKKKQSRSE